MTLVGFEPTTSALLIGLWYPIVYICISTTLQPTEF